MIFRLAVFGWAMEGNLHGARGKTGPVVAPFVDRRPFRGRLDKLFTDRVSCRIW